MVKVAVLDSGLDINSKLSKEIGFNGGIGFYEDEDGTVMMEEGVYDDIGHGTAVASLIKKMCPLVEIIPIRIIKDRYVEKTNTLISCLKYVYEYVPCDLINISAGIVSCTNEEELQFWCRKLVERGTIIVAAYDNLGAVSYPAEFDCVIGISGDRYLDRKISYYKIKNTNNYIGRIKERKLPWLENQMQVVSGTSFLAPEFTAKIAQLIIQGKYGLEEVVNELDQNSMGEKNAMKPNIVEMNFEINKCIVFPFNKEMHSLVRFKDLLDFDIYGLYDTKYAGNIGKTVEELQGIQEKMCVKDINQLDWESDFDTVIMGHTSIINNAVGRDYEKIIINNCIKYNKKLFSCRDIRDRSDLELNKLKFYCPCIEKTNEDELAKMYVIGCPVIGIVGTGGNQGKYTIQLGIRRELINMGYKIGQLGTEPTAQLFGMDAVFPMGHESSVYVKGFDCIKALNSILRGIELKRPDLIVFGSQANTVPFHVGGPQDYPVVQQELILGCQADAYILCVSNDATEEYIRRTVGYLESVHNSKVIAVVISHLAITARWSNFSSLKHYIEESEADDIKRIIGEIVDVPIFLMNEKDIYKKIACTIVDYFGE